jgi:hypothetical protein
MLAAARSCPQSELIFADCALIFAGGKLLILTHDGTLIVAEATPADCHELARYTGLGGRTWTPLCSTAADCTSATPAGLRWASTYVKAAINPASDLRRPIR